jgi:hypothetical protein
MERLRDQYKKTKSVPKAVGNYLKNVYSDPALPTSLKVVSIGLPLYGVGSSILSASDEDKPAAILRGGLNVATGPLVGRLGQIGQEILTPGPTLGLRGNPT